MFVGSGWWCLFCLICRLILFCISMHMCYVYMYILSNDNNVVVLILSVIIYFLIAHILYSEFASLSGQFSLQLSDQVSVCIYDIYIW